MSSSQSSHLAANISDSPPVYPPPDSSGPRHLTQSDITLQQWVETRKTRSFTALCPSPGQGHNARALMGKPDAHTDKHTLTYQTHIMLDITIKIIRHSYSPAEDGGGRGGTEQIKGETRRNS